jgi:transcriptional regulator with XRE-family HTH domain
MDGAVAIAVLSRMSVRRLVGANIRRLRLERGLSQEKLAFEADLDPSYISHVETGAKSPTITTLEKIASALRVKLVQFFDETSASPRLETLPRGTRKRRE